MSRSNLARSFYTLLDGDLLGGPKRNRNHRRRADRRNRRSKDTQEADNQAGADQDSADAGPSSSTRTGTGTGTGIQEADALRAARGGADQGAPTRTRIQEADVSRADVARADGSPDSPCADGRLADVRTSADGDLPGADVDPRADEDRVLADARIQDADMGQGRRGTKRKANQDQDQNQDQDKDREPDKKRAKTDAGAGAGANADDHTDQNDYRYVFKRMIKVLKGDKSEEEEIRKKEAAQKAAREAVRTAVNVTVLTAVAAVATTGIVETMIEATPTAIKTAPFLAEVTLTAPFRAGTTAENNKISSSEEADEPERTATTVSKNMQIDDGEDADDSEDVSVVLEGQEPEGENSNEQEETTTAREEVEDSDSGGQVDHSREEALQPSPERMTPTDLDILMERAAELRAEVALTVHATPGAEGTSPATTPSTPIIVAARAGRAPRATAAERRQQRRAERAQWRREYEEYKLDKENWIECHNGGVPFEDPNRNLAPNPFYQRDGTIEGALRAIEYRRTLDAERAQALARHNDEMRRRALECYRQLRLDYDRLLTRGERVGKRRLGAREHKWRMTVFAASMTPEQLEKEFEIELALAERKAQRSGKAVDLAGLEKEFAEMCAMVEDCKAQVRAKRDRLTWMLR